MNILKGDDLLFWRRIRVRCSEIFRIGSGWLGGERSVRNMWYANSVSYRERDRLDVVVDGNTTLSSLIAEVGSN